GGELSLERGEGGEAIGGEVAAQVRAEVDPVAVGVEAAAPARVDPFHPQAEHAEGEDVRVGALGGCRRRKQSAQREGGAGGAGAKPHRLQTIDCRKTSGAPSAGAVGRKRVAAPRGRVNRAPVPG